MQGDNIEESGKVAGVIFASIDTDTLSKNLTGTIKIGEMGLCYVYTGKGILLIHPRPMRATTPRYLHLPAMD